jgi:hypothetical protein
LPLPITGSVGTRNGVTNGKMMEFFEKAKDTVKEIINGFNAQRMFLVLLPYLLPIFGTFKILATMQVTGIAIIFDN